MLLILIRSITKQLIALILRFGIASYAVLHGYNVVQVPCRINRLHAPDYKFNCQLQTAKLTQTLNPENVTVQREPAQESWYVYIFEILSHTLQIFSRPTTRDH